MKIVKKYQTGEKTLILEMLPEGKNRDKLRRALGRHEFLC